jgi:hypothetical protein
VRLRVLPARESSKWPTGAIVIAVLFGAIALALVVGATLMAARLGWSLRLLSLLGAPVGVAGYWFIMRPPPPAETWRESLPAVSIAMGLISTALNLVFGVSAVYAVFTLSVAAGLVGMTYLRFRGQLRAMRSVIGLIEALDEDDSA